MQSTVVASPRAATPGTRIPHHVQDKYWYAGHYPHRLRRPCTFSPPVAPCRGSRADLEGCCEHCESVRPPLTAQLHGGLSVERWLFPMMRTSNVNVKRALLHNTTVPSATEESPSNRRHSICDLGPSNLQHAVAIPAATALHCSCITLDLPCSDRYCTAQRGLCTLCSWA